ncbi:hypothetical protein LUZ61_001984 [Rhynchospora tenuis]|uniref:FHA domain-containing protein n=1 Tax=Rhynchospora tenuis TaxID=198213 RepID=A0AAD5ZIH8_9POAL|nr:hypothetical protein LUZ61_001984 [Rhynchospora tenuis]
MYRGGLDRFKKAQSIEPFSVTSNLNSKNTPPSTKVPPAQSSNKEVAAAVAAASSHSTQIGGGQSTWQPPDWAIEPRSGVYYLEVMKDREVIDRINLDRKRHLFGRQFPMCDYVLDHQSVSRQHAAVVPHKNGRIFVIDLGSVHGTFVANERLTKDSPVELEVGQSLRFAASTRTYVLRKNNAALFPATPAPSELNLPSPPDPDDLDSVVAYNTILNRYGIPRPDNPSSSGEPSERPAKRSKKARVTFRDQAGYELIQVVGISDGADVGPSPGPLGVKEGSLVGKYESLVQVTVIPKGKEQQGAGASLSPKGGVTEKLQRVMDKVKNGPKSGEGIYDGILGQAIKDNVGGSSWAYKLDAQDEKAEKNAGNAGVDEDTDDLFGD